MPIPQRLASTDPLVQAVEDAARGVDANSYRCESENKAALAAALRACIDYSRKTSDAIGRTEIEVRGTAAVSRSWLCEYAALATGVRVQRLAPDPLLEAVHASVPLALSGTEAAVHACLVLTDLLDRIAWQVMAAAPNGREAAFAVQDFQFRLLPPSLAALRPELARSR